MAEKLQSPKWEYDKRTDVMFVDMATTNKKVETIEVQEDVFIHFEVETGDVVGLRIINWKPFRRYIMRRYFLFRMVDIIERVFEPIVRASESFGHYYHARAHPC